MTSLDIKPAINITRILGFRISYLHVLIYILSLTVIYILLGLIDLILYIIPYAVFIWLTLKNRIDFKKITILFSIAYSIGIFFYLSTHQSIIIVFVGIIIIIVFVVLQYLLAYLVGGIISLIYLITMMYFLSPSFDWFKLLILSVGIWLIMLYLFSYFITSATKKLFNTTIRDIFSSFFMSWFYDDPAVEKLLKSIGKRTQIPVEVIVLKVKDELIYLIFPQFHFGPFGSIGSADTPALFRDYINNNLIFHGLCHHDRDICTREQTEMIIRKIATTPLGDFKRFRFKYKSYDKGNARANVIFSDEFTIIGLSRYPNVTEDLKSGSDIILKSEIREDIKNPILFDQHDSDAKVVTYFSSDSDEFQEYLGAVRKISPQEDLRIAKGAYYKIDTLDSGVGSNGINLLILNNGQQKIAMINIDGNGITDITHKKLEKICRSYDYIPIISTTDSHENNDIAGIINDIDLSDYTIALIESHLKSSNLEDVYYTYRNYEFEVCVLGEEASARLITYLRMSTNFLLAMIFGAMIMNLLILLIIIYLNNFSII
ncbi:MAG: DUF2070 family protein [Candidatus Anstonellales archaeon]